MDSAVRQWRVAVRYRRPREGTRRSMQLRFTVAAPRLGREPVDVLLSAPAGTRLGQVADALRRAVRTPFGRLYCGDLLLPDDAPLGVPPLVHGALVTIDAPGPAWPVPGALELRVVSGPDAGGVHLLRSGEATIGRQADVRLDDPDVSRRHAALTWSGDVVRVRDLGSTNGTLLVTAADVVQVGPEPVELPPGALLRVGESLLEVAVGAPVAEPPPGDGRGHLYVTRQVRPPLTPRTVRIKLPAGSALRRLVARWSARDEVAERLRHDEDVREQVRDALAEEVRLRREAAPSPAELLLTALGRGPRLWERSVDAGIVVRLGVTGLPSWVSVQSSTEHRTLTAPYVPVTVDLRAAGTLGLAGPRTRVDGVARWVVAQVAGCYSPAEVGLAIAVGGGDPAAGWWWARWLPHLGEARLGLGGEATRLLEALAVGASQDADTRPLVLVTDLAGHPALGELPSHACAVVLTDDADRLPATCAARVLVTGEVGTQLRIEWPLAEQDGATGAARAAPLPGPLADVPVECVSAAWAERYARALAPLREAPQQTRMTQKTLSDQVDGAGEPVRLARLLKLDPPRGARGVSPRTAWSERVAALWRGGRKPMVAVLGAADDRPYPVDLRAEGPHALFVGPAASALLRAVLVSLAATNRPAEVGFALLPGTAALDGLPHCVGSLPPGEGARSRIRAELARREELLKDAGVDDYPAYRAAGHRLHRLVIAVDDLSGLAGRDPALLDLLQDAAGDGHRLGVHLLCATSRLTDALRPVRDLADLRVVAGPAEPAAVRETLGVDRPVTGHRAYARSGPGPVVTFRYATVDTCPGEPAVAPLDWAALTGAALTGARAVDPGGDLALLVAAVAEAARAEDVPPPLPLATGWQGGGCAPEYPGNPPPGPG